MSEPFDSNTLNPLVGATLPAIIGGVAAPASSAVLTVWWLAGLTTVSVVFTGYRAGLGRGEGVVVMVLYLPPLLSWWPRKAAGRRPARQRPGRIPPARK
ncbi:MAG: hypothetical protein ACRDN0_26510 [Trebonia sp.]